MVNATSFRKLAHAIYKDIFQKQQLKISLEFFFYFFLYIGSKYTLWYMLEPPRGGGSKAYPQCMFGIKKNKNNRYTPANPSFFYINVGFKGVSRCIVSPYLCQVLQLG